MKKKEIVLSVDLEKPYRNAEKGADFLIEIFKKYHIKTTFFVTEDIIDENHDLLLKLKNEGHEIAYHGFHIPYFKKNILNMNKEEIIDELIRAKQKLQRHEINVKGFRAEGLRINQDTLNEIAKHYRYDSSLSKLENGSPIYTLESGLTEISVVKIFNLARFHPLLLVYLNIKFLIKILGFHPLPIVLYFHSFDFIAPLQVIQRKTSKLKQMVYYNYLGGRMCRKFEKMLCLLKREGYSFPKMQDLAKN